MFFHVKKEGGGHVWVLKMKINYTKGSKGSKDRKIWVETSKQNDNGEPITIFRLGLLVNQLAINERKIHNLDWSRFPFYFRDFIDKTMKDATEGIDWAEPENEEHIEEICSKYMLGSESIDYKLLRRTQQTKLREFDK